MSPWVGQRGPPGANMDAFLACSARSLASEAPQPRCARAGGGARPPEQSSSYVARSPRNYAEHHFDEVVGEDGPAQYFVTEPSRPKTRLG